MSEVYKTYIINCYDNLFRTIYFPDENLLKFEDFPNDFDFMETDEKYTVVFKSIKPKTTLSIFKKTKVSEISIDVMIDKMVQTYSKTESIYTFDKALDKIIDGVKISMNGN